MSISQIVKESQLDAWVRGNSSEAQGKIVELVWRLVCASCSQPSHRRFPLGDSIDQHGADGELVTEIGFPPFVPEGKSIWEIGTNINAHRKANDDYRGLTDVIPEEVRKLTTFVFVTPLSGRRDWRDTWKQDGIETWVAKKKNLQEWKDVIVLDGTQLTDWTIQFPAIGNWLGALIGQLPDDFDTAEFHWEVIRNYGYPPPLSYELFTKGREAAAEKLRRVIIERTDSQLRLDTRYPNHSADFVSAFISSLPEEERFEHQSRILIFQSEETWKKACALNESHVFVANFDLDIDAGPQLIQRALQRRHAVIYSGSPGGPPHGNSCELLGPRVHQIKESLVKSGYSEERARNLTNKAHNDLNALLRLIQNLSTMPEWATQSEASDMAIAQLLGQWKDECEGDQTVAGDLSGNDYGEWITRIRRVASTKTAPLEFFNGCWKFTSRYEPWLYLGNLIGADVLERFERLAIKVLSEPDPSLDLPKEQRSAVSIYGRGRRYSKRLRQGIAETLALLGTHGNALSACPEDRPRNVAWGVVRELLNGVGSVRCASLNDVLALLAEAAPDAFLNAVGGASEKLDEPFSGVFAEEGDSFMGGSYVTGLLWALESLAWSSDYLVRVCGILANLATVDPGGMWSNRPSNSLTTILLPWLPQTCGDADKRHAAVKCIVGDHPKVAWNLLLTLLPESHSSSNYTYRPKWRNYIPENWRDGVTNGQRWADEAYYAELALQLAGDDPKRLSELVNYYFQLDFDFRRVFRERLESEEVLSLPEDQRLELWTILTTRTAKHRKYADSDAWVQSEEALQELDAIADKLKPLVPEVRHKQLFSGRDIDLYDKKGNWEKQRNRLLQKRIVAIREILDRGGFENLKVFLRSVESPHEVGSAYGADSNRADDTAVLPAMLECKNEADNRFATSYIWSRFQGNLWTWVDGLDRSQWSVAFKAEFFSALPFMNEAWERVVVDLSDNENEYWKCARVRPERDHLERIDYAIDRLIVNGRSDAAIQCFWLCDLHGGIFSELGLRALEAFNNQNHVDAHAIGELFNQLQQDQTVDKERLAAMEMKFLEMLNPFGNSRPRTLYRHLAERPDFFCEVIQRVYHSKREVEEQPDQKPEVGDNKAKIAGRAYNLLSHWDHPPGRVEDSGFDGQHLKEWCAAVKTKCIESRHWEVASHQIGEVLFYAPQDEDGLWVEPVCEVFNSKEDVEFRRGLRIRIFNSRGTHGFSGGKEEIELAEKWERIAELAENKGFARLGTTLRELGKSYREDAKRSVLEHRHELG